MRVAVRALVLGAVALGLAGCWPVPGHDPNWTGYNDLEVSITAGTVADLEPRWTWTSPPGSPTPVRSPVVSAAAVHVAVGCALVAIHPVSGAQRWHVELAAFPDISGHTLPCNGYNRQAREPFVIGDRVYAGMVLRFDGRPPPGPINPVYRAATGAWDVTTGEAVPGSEAAVALTARRGDAVASLDGVGGWFGTPPIITPYITTWPLLGTLGGPQRRLPSDGDGRVTLGTDVAYVVEGTNVEAFAIDDPRFACGDTATEECPLWSVSPDGSPIVGRPVIGRDGTTVYAGTSAGTLFAFDVARGAVSWSAPVGSAVTDSPALGHDTLYVPTASGDLIAVPAEGCGEAVCARAWSASTGSAISGQPVVAGDVVVTGSDDGALRAFDARGCGAATCAALWSASAGSEVTGMAVSAGQLYVGTADSRLVAYGLP